MGVVILHSPYDCASRAFVASLGVDIPQDDDVMLDVGGIGVRIVSDHARCVAINPTFSAYPVLLYTLGQDTYQLDAPASWQQCLEFMDAPWGPEGPPAPKRIMSVFEFRTRLLTFEERKTLDNSTIPELVTMRTDLLAAQEVDLAVVAQYRDVMLGTGLATAERIDQILAGQAPQ